MYADYVELLSMNVKLKMFCILCICIILCDTSKASQNLTFILKRSLILSSDFVVATEIVYALPVRLIFFLLICPGVSEPHLHFIF